MRFVFDKEKAAQGAAFIIKQNGGPIDLLALIKLLYLADRKSLIDTGMTITGDKMVNMDQGPVLSFTYDEAKWPRDGREDAPWCRLMTDREGNKIDLQVEDPPVDRLSEYETDTLREVFELHGRTGTWQLRDFSHDLPEWHDPEGSSIEIKHEEILRSAGLSDEQIRDMVRSAEERYFLAAGTPLEAQ